MTESLFRRFSDGESKDGLSADLDSLFDWQHHAGEGKASPQAPSDAAPGADSPSEPAVPQRAPVGNWPQSLARSGQLPADTGNDNASKVYDSDDYGRRIIDDLHKFNADLSKLSVDKTYANATGFGWLLGKDAKAAGEQLGQAVPERLANEYMLGKKLAEQGKNLQNPTTLSAEEHRALVTYRIVRDRISEEEQNFGGKGALLRNVEQAIEAKARQSPHAEARSGPRESAARAANPSEKPTEQKISSPPISASAPAKLVPLSITSLSMGSRLPQPQITQVEKQSAPQSRGLPKLPDALERLTSGADKPSAAREKATRQSNATEDARPSATGASAGQIREIRESDAGQVKSQPADKAENGSKAHAARNIDGQPAHSLTIGGSDFKQGDRASSSKFAGAPGRSPDPEKADNKPAGDTRQSDRKALSSSTGDQTARDGKAALAHAADQKSQESRTGAANPAGSLAPERRTSSTSADAPDTRRAALKESASASGDRAREEQPIKHTPTAPQAQVVREQQPAIRSAVDQPGKGGAATGPAIMEGRRDSSFSSTSLRALHADIYADGVRRQSDSSFSTDSLKVPAKPDNLSRSPEAPDRSHLTVLDNRAVASGRSAPGSAHELISPQTDIARPGKPGQAATAEAGRAKPHEPDSTSAIKRDVDGLRPRQSKIELAPTITQAQSDTAGGAQPGKPIREHGLSEAGKPVRQSDGSSASTAGVRDTTTVAGTARPAQISNGSQAGSQASRSDPPARPGSAGTGTASAVDAGQSRTGKDSKGLQSTCETTRITDKRFITGTEIALAAVIAAAGAARVRRELGPAGTSCDVSVRDDRLGGRKPLADSGKSSPILSDARTGGRTQQADWRQPGQLPAQLDIRGGLVAHGTQIALGKPVPANRLATDFTQTHRGHVDPGRFVPMTRVDDRRYLPGAEIAMAAILAVAGITRVRGDDSFPGTDGVTAGSPFTAYAGTDDQPGILRGLAERLAFTMPLPGVAMCDGARMPISARNRNGNDRLSDKQANSSGNSSDVDEQSDGTTAAATSDDITRYAVLRRPTVLVSPGDTLIGIAEAFFHDANLGWLIADLNKERIKESLEDGKRIVEIKSRQQLELPVWDDIVRFYHTRPIEAMPENLVTVVDETGIDAELLQLSLGSVVGTRAITTGTVTSEEWAKGAGDTMPGRDNGKAYAADRQQTSWPVYRKVIARFRRSSYRIP